MAWIESTKIVKSSDKYYIPESASEQQNSDADTPEAAILTQTSSKNME